MKSADNLFDKHRARMVTGLNKITAKQRCKTVSLCADQFLILEMGRADRPIHTVKPFNRIHPLQYEITGPEDEAVADFY